jgi:membrane associated rhomboid family serine protease
MVDKSPIMGLRLSRYWATIGGLIALIILIELVLKGADLRLWGSPAWRSWAYIYLSFQPRLLAGHDPLWSGEYLGMFLTHVFLHVGLLHVASNMVAFALLAYLLRDKISLRALLATCLLSAVVGALLFALLAPSASAMTGASGALSGLGVVWAAGNAPGQVRSTPRQNLILFGAIIILILLIEVLPGIQTAWQAHVGGALAGAGVSIFRSHYRN